MVRDDFTESMGWSCTKASYSLACTGSNSTSIQGKLWNISLKDENHIIRKIKGYGVTNILKENL